MRVLGLINARGGSKGVPRKNVKLLHGKPLIAYTIEEALAARRIDRVVVSTDDREIAEVAVRHGADVPFLRPAALAEDRSLQIDVVKHALAALRQMGDSFDVVVILQPTSPLRQAQDIDGVLELLEAQRADSVVSVCTVENPHPHFMYRVGDDGTLQPLIESDAAGTLRQDFPTLWYRNGAIYAVRTAVVMERNSLYGERTCGYPMPAARSANIDSPLDWYLTEALLDYREES